MTARNTDLKRGTQIAYVPMHASGSLHHPDVERGFVTSVSGSFAFCRYWSKHSPGELRTKANSEGTPLECIVVVDSVPQADVDAALAVIDHAAGHHTG